MVWAFKNKTLDTRGTTTLTTCLDLVLGPPCDISCTSRTRQSPPVQIAAALDSAARDEEMGQRGTGRTGRDVAACALQRQASLGRVLSGNFGGLPATDRQIVIDGCNVAWNYKDCQGFSTEGLEFCLEWFLARNFSNIIAFVPKSYCQTPAKAKRPSRSAYAAKSGFYSNRADDIEGLRRLEQRGLVKFTPPGGDDDAFIIEFAYQSQGWIVSNDNYREFRKSATPQQCDWLLWHKIFYTFLGKSFVPTAPKIHRKPPANFVSHDSGRVNGFQADADGSGEAGGAKRFEDVQSSVAYDVSLQLAADRHQQRLEG